MTLEGTQGKKVVLDEVEVALFPYTYRLGYHLIKEYQSTLLFRSGCGATGPCIYTLVDKSTGKKVQKFTQLICIDTDARLANSRPYAYNFVVYFSENYDSLNVYFIDTKKSLQTSFDIRNNKVTSVIPEHQFISMSKTDNVVTLTYKNDDNISTKLKINVANAKYHR